MVLLMSTNVQLLTTNSDRIFVGHVSAYLCQIIKAISWCADSLICLSVVSSMSAYFITGLERNMNVQMMVCVDAPVKYSGLTSYL